MNYYKIFILFLFSCLLMAGRSAQAQTPQKSKHVIQLSGVVVPADDSTAVLPGVHIFVPKAGRGTTSNMLGFFSMPVLPGDSVVVSAVGYRRQSFIIPDIEDDKYTRIIELATDTTYLEELTVFPYPTEELFKEAVLALEFPDQEEQDFMRRNTDPELLAMMVENTPMDGSENFKYYQQQQLMQMHQRYGMRPNPLLNPLNWMNFIQSIRRGDYKKD